VYRKEASYISEQPWAQHCSS